MTDKLFNPGAGNRIFLLGPDRSPLSQDYQKRATVFAATATALKEEGYDVINLPSYKKTAPHRTEVSLVARRADFIVLLPDWIEDTYAQSIATVAAYMAIPVVETWYSPDGELYFRSADLEINIKIDHKVTRPKEDSIEEQ